jgi:hypothetical protein
MPKTVRDAMTESPLDRHVGVGGQAARLREGAGGVGLGARIGNAALPDSPCLPKHFDRVG